MLRPRTHACRRALLVAPAFLIVAVAGCGDDDDADSIDTVVVGINGTAPETSTAEADEVESDDGPSEDTRDYPSLEEVGRADFRHTIVAGDFLRSIADTYDVEIDDIVGANEWDDGRDHLLLPGQEIYLPADAVKPPETTAPAGTVDDGGSGDEGQGAAPGDADLCVTQIISDSYAIGADDTLDDVAERLGISAEVLQEANQFGVNGKPAFGEQPTIEVPCTATWPPNVEFPVLVDPPVCSPDNLIAGVYTVREGDTADSILAAMGLPPQNVTRELLINHNSSVDFDALQPGSELEICYGWFVN